MSGRARGIPSRSAINVEYPYQVAVRDIEGQRLSGIRCSGSYSSLCQWRHTVGDGKHSYEVFCFGDATQAAAFRELIAGEVFDYRDQVGARWDRGRGARRDGRRR